MSVYQEVAHYDSETFAPPGSRAWVGSAFVLFDVRRDVSRETHTRVFMRTAPLVSRVAMRLHFLAQALRT